MIARKVVIEGLVQGVFFREWTVGRAREFGVSGWVRNRRDGGVEVFAVGEAPQVSRLIERLHSGAPASRVDKVHVEEAAIEDFDGFNRRQTA